MVKVQVGFVKDHNLPSLHARTVRAPAVVMLAGGSTRARGQKGLQFEPDVTLGGSFAPAVLGPSIHGPPVEGWVGLST